jgi:hypothetical protein
MYGASPNGKQQSIGEIMMAKLAKVGYRVAPMYQDGPNGSIVEVLDDLYVMVKWDVTDLHKVHQTQKEQIKFLRKGAPEARGTECPLCERGSLTPKTWTGVFRKVTVTGLECNSCDTCDAEPILTDQIRRNQVRIQNARSTAAADPSTSIPV